MPAPSLAGRITFAIAALAFVPEAAAQVSEKAMAEALFQEGRSLLEQGKTAEACSRFESSQRLEAKLGTLLNVALCHEQLGKTASSWAEFIEAAELAARSGEPKREAFAREHARALESKLSRLTITRTGATPAAAISIDGRPLDPALMGRALPLDPGKHVIEARAPGKQRWSQEVEIAPGSARAEVRVPDLVDEAVASPAPAPPAPAPMAPLPVAAPPGITPDPQRGDPSPLVWAGFGVAAAGVAVGAVTGLMAASKASDLTARCPNDVCSPADSDALSSANTMANVANVSFAVAAAGAVVGTVALVVLRSPRDRAAVVTVGPRGAGGSVRVRF